MITERGYGQKAFNHIVAEWEDDLATDLHAGLVHEQPICRNPRIRFLGNGASKLFAPKGLFVKL